MRDGGSYIKNTANIITSLRILFALGMLFLPPFSVSFWICYIAAGLSDVLDGIAARALKQQSDFGAKLDSAADAVFAAVIAAILIAYISIPMWLWVWIICIALLRFAGCAIGYCKYRSFSSLHTYANKASGGLVFLLPLLYMALGIEASGIFLCLVSSLAAVEELIITASSKELFRDRRSIFTKQIPSGIPAEIKKGSKQT